MPLTAEDTLDDWLGWLEQQHPKAIDLGLERIHLVAKKLNLAGTSNTVVTVAGTNGKGSCIALMESICLAAGLRVGTYTSPHITHYCERIKLNGRPVSEKTLCQHLAKVTGFNDETTLTYFEYGTLAALSIFQEQPLDILFLEVGMGGRLDAVNIIDSDFAIITHIDIDHTEWLGDNREAIGREKAGIFRSGQRAICGDLNPPNSVIEHGQALGTDIAFLQRDFFYTEKENMWDWSAEGIVLNGLPKPSLRLDNAAIALQGIALLSDKWAISPEAICQGLRHVHLPARQQLLTNTPMTLFDVAHNPDACRALAENVSHLKAPGQRILSVVGMLEDKDVGASLAPFDDLVDEWYLGDLTVRRAAQPQALLDNLPEKSQPRGKLFDSIPFAWEYALKQATDKDLIIVFGSFHTVAQVFAIMAPHA